MRDHRLYLSDILKSIDSIEDFVTNPILFRCGSQIGMENDKTPHTTTENLD